MRDGQRITSATIRRRLVKICGRLGLKYKPPHKIRKTCATRWFENVADEKILRDVFGWNSIQVGLLHYDGRKSDDKRNKKAADSVQFYTSING